MESKVSPLSGDRDWAVGAQSIQVIGLFLVWSISRRGTHDPEAEHQWWHPGLCSASDPGRVAGWWVWCHLTPGRKPGSAPGTRQQPGPGRLSESCFLSSTSLGKMLLAPPNPGVGRGWALLPIAYFSVTLSWVFASSISGCSSQLGRLGEASWNPVCPGHKLSFLLRSFWGRSNLFLDVGSLFCFCLHSAKDTDVPCIQFFVLGCVSEELGKCPFVKYLCMVPPISSKTFLQSYAQQRSICIRTSPCRIAKCEAL